MSLLTFIVIIVLGAVWGHHAPADPVGQNFTGLGNYPNTTTNVPVTQVGLNQLASDSARLGVSINFTWTLVTGFLVLFMQVGFAFLVTGLTRAKNAGHMMMMNIAAFAVALLAYYAVGFAFQFGGIAPIANLGGVSPLTGIVGHGSAGVIGLHGFLLQSHGTYDVGVMVLFLFEVVFMETAGYIIIGAIAERISFAGFLLAEIAMGAVIYPIYGMWMWGGGWLAHLGISAHLGSRRGRLRRLRGGPRHRRLGGARTCHGARAAHREVQQGRVGQCDPGPQHPVRRGRDDDPRVRVDGLQPWLDARRHRPAHRARRGQHVARGVRRVRDGDDHHRTRSTGSPTSRCRATACSRDWSRSLPAARSWPHGPRSSSAGWPERSSCTASRSSTADTSTTRAVRSRCTASTARGACSSVGLFADGTYGAGWNGVTGNVKGLFYGDVGQLWAQIAHVFVGFVWAWGITWLIFKVAQKFMQIRVSEEVELQGLDVPEFGALAYPDFVLHHSIGGHVTTDAEEVGNGSTRTVDLERS